MAVYSTNEFKGGVKILIDGDPFNIIENEFVKPGKGQAFNRVRIKNLKNGRVIERTFKSGETVEAADVADVQAQYLYNDGEFWYFMAVDTFEQYNVSKVAVEDAAKWLKEQDLCFLVVWNGTTLSVTPPNFVELKIVETDPGLKGDTSGGGGKPATLETGLVVTVPFHISEGDLLKVDTRTGEYVEKVKK